jgi:hypothetical protein
MMKKTPTCPACKVKMKSSKTFYWCNNHDCDERETYNDGTARVITLDKPKEKKRR